MGFCRRLSESWQSIQLSGGKVVDLPSYKCRYYLEAIANVALLETRAQDLSNEKQKT